MLTGQASLDSAVEALRAGVSDYLLKPLRPAQLEVVFQRLAARRTLESEVETLRAELQETGKLGELIGKSAAMVKVFDAIRRVARLERSGPDHRPERDRQGGRRADDPSPLPARVGALRRVQLRRDLADADRERALRPRARLLHRRRQAPRSGYFEEANGGTLLLDEITEMGPELQVKLLRVLEAKTLRRVGGTQDLRVDVRLVSATNRDPLEAIQQGKLREDLYYRLNVFPIALAAVWPIGARTSRCSPSTSAGTSRSRRRRA